MGNGRNIIPYTISLSNAMLGSSSRLALACHPFVSLPSHSPLIPLPHSSHSLLSSSLPSRPFNSFTSRLYTPLPLPQFPLPLLPTSYFQPMISLRCCCRSRPISIIGLSNMASLCSKPYRLVDSMYRCIKHWLLVQIRKKRTGLP